MAKLRVITPAAAPSPSLDAVVNEFDSAQLAELPPDAVARLLERAASAHGKLLGAALLARKDKADTVELLSVEQAAALCDQSPAWVRRSARHSRAWATFVHRLSRKAILFDRAGLLAWLRSRRS